MARVLRRTGDERAARVLAALPATKAPATPSVINMRLSLFLNDKRKPLIWPPFPASSAVSRVCWVARSWMEAIVDPRARAANDQDEELPFLVGSILVRSILAFLFGLLLPGLLFASPAPLLVLLLSRVLRRLALLSGLLTLLLSLLAGRLGLLCPLLTGRLPFLSNLLALLQSLAALLLLHHPVFLA